MRILCLPYTHTYSHLSRPLAVAQELAARGHEVIFAGDSPKMQLIRESGFATEELYEPDPKVLFDNIRSGKLKFVTETELDRMVEADVELVRKVQPDLVLTDGRFSARLSVPASGVRHAAIVNVSSTEYRANPYIPMFQPVIGLLGAEAREKQFASGIRNACDSNLACSVRRFVEGVNLSIEMFVFDTVMSVFAKRTKSMGLRKRVTATNCLAGTDLTLLADIPEYFPVKGLPRHYHFVGPMVWSGKSVAPDWWPMPDVTEDSRPFVYVCMGTTAIPSLFDTVFAMMDANNMRGVITTGGQYDGLPEDHPEIRVTPFIDGALVLEKSSIVICHGGNGTIYQALEQGVPLVGLPTIPDQKFNMRRVEALGAGISIAPKRFERNPDVLPQAVHTILNTPRYTTSAKLLADVLATYDAPKTSADFIEEVMR